MGMAPSINSRKFDRNHFQNSYSGSEVANEMSSLRSDNLKSLERSFSEKGRIRRRIQQCVKQLGWMRRILTIRAAKRSLDVSFALVMLVVTLPLQLLLLLLCRGVEKTPRVGRYHKPFNEFSYPGTAGIGGKIANRLHLNWLPSLINILRGDMSLIGPRAAAPGELSPRQRVSRQRYDVRPGLICLWWIRQRSNISFDTEAAVDAEYVESHSPKGDLGILLRAIPASLYGQSKTPITENAQILGIPIHNVTMDAAISEIIERAHSDVTSRVCYLNADCANIAWNNSEYRDALTTAEMTLADGIGVKLAGKFLRQGIRQNVNGTDLFPRLCAALVDSDSSIYLLGGKPGIAEGVCEYIQKNHPGVKIAGEHHGFYKPEEEQEIILNIRKSGATILLVAMGCPKQDLWVKKNLDATGCKVGMGVGGLFDFFSGRIPRAPIWMREIGMEWVFRFMQEPGRLWKRYIVGNIVFLARVAACRYLGRTPK